MSLTISSALSFSLSMPGCVESENLDAVRSNQPGCSASCCSLPSIRLSGYYNGSSTVKRTRLCIVETVTFLSSWEPEPFPERLG
jgi:hypothetical protein